MIIICIILLLYSRYLSSAGHAYCTKKAESIIISIWIHYKLYPANFSIHVGEFVMSLVASVVARLQ